MTFEELVDKVTNEFIFYSGIEAILDKMIEDQIKDMPNATESPENNKRQI